MDLVFVQTGGTIDKDYPERENDHGYEFAFGEPAFLSVIERARLPYKWLYGTIMRKDSLDMDDKDRTAICRQVDELKEKKIIITHGTDTIHLTAAVLSCIKDKTIVLTGSMQPEKFRDSDADFNLGMAVAAVQHLPFGIYIALYGEVKPWLEFKPR